MTTPSTPSASSEPGQPDYPLIEEVINSLTHAIGLLLSIAGTAVLVASASVQGDPWKIVSFSVFGASLALLYGASMLYHGSRRPQWRALYKMLDHCAIFALIAGTYTPFLLVNLRGPMGWALFAVVWSLALGGIALRLIWPHRFSVLRAAVCAAFRRRPSSCARTACSPATSMRMGVAGTRARA